MCYIPGLETLISLGAGLGSLFSSSAAPATAATVASSAAVFNGTAATTGIGAIMSGGALPGITGASTFSMLGAGSLGTTAGTTAAAGSTLAANLALTGGIAGGVAGVAGGAMTAVDAITTGNAQAKIAENNAKIAQEQKKQEAGVNHRDQSDLMRRASIEKGRGIGSFGASGIDMSSGTVGSWLNDFDTGMNRDLSTMDYNSKLKQWGLENERRNSLSQAKIYRRQIPLNAAAGLTSGVLGGVSALGSGIGTFSKLGGKF